MVTIVSKFILISSNSYPQDEFPTLILVTLYSLGVISCLFLSTMRVAIWSFLPPFALFFMTSFVSNLCLGLGVSTSYIKLLRSRGTNSTSNGEANYLINQSGASSLLSTSATFMCS